jgi:hypothetical protein
MNELRNRGVADIPVAVVDGLRGFPDAITAAFPQAMTRTCVVRHSLAVRSWKDRKSIASSPKAVYRPADAELHQALGGKADRLAQKIRATSLLGELSQVHHGFGHRGHPSVQVGSRNPTLPSNPMTASATPRTGTRPGSPRMMP